jgi:hypothetical protein
MTQVSESGGRWHRPCAAVIRINTMLLFRLPFPGDTWFPAGLTGH